MATKQKAKKWKVAQEMFEDYQFDCQMVMFGEEPSMQRPYESSLVITIWSKRVKLTPA